jgi:hypothetical protein
MIGSFASGTMTVTDLFQSRLNFLKPPWVKKCQIRDPKPTAKDAFGACRAEALAKAVKWGHILTFNN